MLVSMCRRIGWTLCLPDRRGLCRRARRQRPGGTRQADEGLAPELIAVEATGGYETVVAAALAGAGLPLAVVNPAQMRHFAPRSANAPRPIRSTRR